MAAVLSESVLDQNGPKWSKRPFWSKWPYSELDFGIRETKMDQNGPFWSILVHFGPTRSILVHLGPFRSANRTLAIPVTLASRNRCRFELHTSNRRRGLSMLWSRAGNPPPKNHHPNTNNFRSCLSFPFMIRQLPLQSYTTPEGALWYLLNGMGKRNTKETMMRQIPTTKENSQKQRKTAKTWQQVPACTIRRATKLPLNNIRRPWPSHLWRCHKDHKRVYRHIQNYDLSNSKTFFKTVTVTIILWKYIQIIFKMVIGNQWKWRCDCGRQDGNSNGN